MQPAEKRFWLPWCVGVFAIAAALLFYGLGHYPLWCDEADTALFARGIARTGDLSAVLDQNIYAFRAGSCLKNLRGRYQPPAAYYLAAPFVGSDGTSTFWPRFPFAMCGLASVALLLYWMVESRISALSWVVLSLGLVGNVSFFLFCRQCRYFALVTLLTVAIAYLYLHWNGQWWKLTALMLASVVLIWTHYLAYAALYAVLAVDYLWFHRRSHRLGILQWLLLLAPQVLAGIVAVMIFNPFDAAVVPRLAGHSWIGDKLLLLWWNLRDLNASEFGVGLLMLVAPWLYLLDRNHWLLRAPVAILLYILVVVIFSPQMVGFAGELDPQYLSADVRYLAPILPLCIFLTALSILTLSRYKWAIALPLALVAFGTNVLNVPWNMQQWRSTSLQWLDELYTARTTSIDRAIEWLDGNVRSGQSVLVMPNYMTYPLMYYAPHVLYAWQLDLPPQEQFKNLPPIHFVGGAPPDYILEFRRRAEVDHAMEFLKNQRQASYAPIGRIDVYWDDMTRPELLWRSFKPKLEYKPDIEAVYLWQRTSANSPAR